MSARAAAGADLFGQVQITSLDLAAWLLCVPRIDPASPQAGGYVRGYDVLQKIARAKEDGTFDEVLAQAEQSARFRELAECGLPREVVADLFMPRQAPVLPVKGKRPRMWRCRPKEVVQAERTRLAAEAEQRRAKDKSLLCRLPSGVPSLSWILGEIGSPSAYHLARAMHVTTEEAARWIEEDHAPHSVMLALFWLTRHGVSMIDADAHNAAVLQANLAAANGREAERLRNNLSHVERIADFGSANDPLPNVQAHLAELAHPVQRPAAPPGAPMLATEHDEATQRRDACAA